MITHAIDLGFGLTKFTSGPASAQRFNAFPSVAVPARGRSSASYGHDLELKTVEFDGGTYLVGPDARRELAGNELGRDLTEDFYRSHTYHVLMRGALAFMGESEIDVLVLGLPMDRFENRNLVQNLQSQYQGEIMISPNKTVAIARCEVHPQPFGGYIGLGRQIPDINAALADFPASGIKQMTKPSELAELNVLVVDSGSFTLDWLLMSGQKGPVRSASSAANNAGRHRVLRALYEQICRDLSRKPPVSIMLEIDDAQRSGKPLRIDGRAIDFTAPEYVRAAQDAVEDSVQQMFEHLGSMLDRVDIVACIGGAPHEVAAAIARRRPHLPLYSPGVEKSLFMNLSGFADYAKSLTSGGR